MGGRPWLHLQCSHCFDAWGIFAADEYFDNESEVHSSVVALELCFGEEGTHTHTHTHAHLMLVPAAQLLVAWFLYMLDRRRKSSRFSCALVRYRGRLLAAGVSQWIKVCG